MLETHGTSFNIMQNHTTLMQHHAQPCKTIYDCSRIMHDVAQWFCMMLHLRASHASQPASADDMASAAMVVAPVLLVKEAAVAATFALPEKPL
eukprot:7096078-Heterocapsa_arctica.AAC.1